MGLERLARMDTPAPARPTWIRQSPNALLPNFVKADTLLAECLLKRT